MKKLIVASIATLAIVSIAFAKHHGKGHHGPHGKHHGKMMDQELKAKLDSYKSENVLPKMTEWKTTIDNGLSSEDLAKLNVLRKEAKAMREKSKAEMVALKAKKEAGEEVERSDLKEIFKKNKEQMKSIGERLNEIVENNEELIKTISEEAKEYRDTWHSAVKEIMEEHREAKKAEMEENGEERKDRKKRKKRDRHHDKKDMEMMNKVKSGMVRLLLWDGESDMNQDFDLNRSDMFDLNSSANPNPFTESSNIQFELPESEFVKVYVIDQSGKIVKVLHEGELKAGANSFNFNPQNINDNSVYLYKIESKSVNETGKLILSK